MNSTRFQVISFIEAARFWVEAVIIPCLMTHVDRQTLKDLEIFETPGGSESLFSRLALGASGGGRVKLREKFERFLGSCQEINEVQDCLKFLLHNTGNWQLIIKEEPLQAVEYYLLSNVAPILASNRFDTLLQIVRYRLLYRVDYAYIRGGAFRFLYFLREVQTLVDRFRKAELPPLLQQWLAKVEAILSSEMLSRAITAITEERYSFLSIVEFDRAFRVKNLPQVRALLDLLYELDAWIAMAKGVRKHHFVFPEMLETHRPTLIMEGLYHPLLSSPIGNPVDLSGATPFMFLTGPNMAGKTTYMKSCGVAVYLAHVGMGVPATSAQMSVLEGLFTSIHTTDYLAAGYSYFYREVRRVKEAAEKLRQNQKLLIMFDELFKGTNVKDAYDCSKVVTTGFQNFPNSLFILSSHITELARDLQPFPSVTFKFMESKVENGKPVFSYRMADGVSEERLGLLILQNERIGELLNGV